MPGPGGYWLGPLRTASAASSRISPAPSVSGKPWPRLMLSGRHRERRHLREDRRAEPVHACDERRRRHRATATSARLPATPSPDFDLTAHRVGAASQRCRGEVEVGGWQGVRGCRTTTCGTGTRAGRRVRWHAQRCRRSRAGASAASSPADQARARRLDEVCARACGEHRPSDARRGGGRIERSTRPSSRDLDLYEQQRWRTRRAGGRGRTDDPRRARPSHSTAAVVLRGCRCSSCLSAPCVTVVPWHTGEIPRVHVHRCTAEAVAFPYDSPLGQLPCHGVERTVLDIAREHGVVAGVVAADCGTARAARPTVSRLETALGHCVRWPGVRAAREAVQRADGRSESPLETRSRLKIADFGLPAPSLQVDLGDALGRFIGRADFYWDEFGVVGRGRRRAQVLADRMRSRC